ncbi:MAG TPA: zf-HC2 domain-containing protein [Vicinamibacteria bacterium]|nr:zf-HC2 domain-containing protein [Vicinamibacteria bacterium]
MSGCDAFRRLVSAYLDGELVDEDRAAFEAHVRECEACRSSLEDERRVVQAVQRSLPLHQTPAGLRDRVDRLLAAPLERARPAGWGTPLVVAASLVALALAGVALLQRSSAAPPRVASAFAAVAADSHLRHARGQLPLEVRSEAPAEVSAFFAGRVPFHLTLPDYPVDPGARKPYHLVGGRLVAFQDDYMAFVAYRMDDRPISLLVTSEDRVRPAGGSEVASGGLTFHFESVSGLKVITWSDKGLTYALVSDLAVTGSRSCIVCHGSDEERRKIEGL